jgi:hypothetical protein
MLALGTPYVQLRIEQSTVMQLCTTGAAIFGVLVLLKVAIGVGKRLCNSKAMRLCVHRGGHLSACPVERLQRFRTDGLH